MHLIFQISISRNTKCAHKVGFCKSGHVCRASTRDKAASVLNYQLQLISQWAAANKMKINHSKSTVMWSKISNR